MGIRKAYVDTREGQVHYRYTGEIGGGGLPLVLLHKTASSSRMFERTMEKLDGRYPMLAFDTPGFGESYEPEEVPNLGYYIDVLLEALDRLGVDRFNLLGHHTGANLGVQMGALFGKRIHSLILIGPSILSAEEREEYRTRYGPVFNRPVADGSHLQKTWDYIARMGGSATLELHQREAIDHIKAWRARSQAYSAVWDEDFGSYYQRVECPIMIMCARDDVLWPLFERAKEARPDAESVIIEGANFEPDIDPDGIVQAVESFLG